MKLFGLGFFNDLVWVDIPFQCIAYVCTKKFKWVCDGYEFKRDVYGRFGGGIVLEINDQFLDFVCVAHKIVVIAPRDCLGHLLPTTQLAIFGYGAYYGCVISVLKDGYWTELGYETLYKEKSQGDKT